MLTHSLKLSVQSPGGSGALGADLHGLHGLLEGRDDRPLAQPKPIKVLVVADERPALGLHARARSAPRTPRPAVVLRCPRRVCARAALARVREHTCAHSRQRCRRRPSALGRGVTTALALPGLLKGRPRTLLRASNGRP